MREDRGYDPDIGDVEKARQQQIILKLIERSGYAESQGGDGWSKYMIPGLVTLIVTAIIGNVIQYAEVSSLKTALVDFTTSMERRVDNLEQRVFKGAP